MTHHAKIIVPRPPLRAPDCAGKWKFTGVVLEHVAGSGLFQWGWWERMVHLNLRVTVEETPSAGRFCRSLRMGGHALCGFDDWSGEWSKA